MNQTTASTNNQDVIIRDRQINELKGQVQEFRDLADHFQRLAKFYRTLLEEKENNQ